MLVGADIEYGLELFFLEECKKWQSCNFNHFDFFDLQIDMDKIWKVGLGNLSVLVWLDSMGLIQVKSCTVIIGVVL